MASKTAKRGVSVFIDGSAIPSSAKAIRKEYQKLIRDQDDMIEGSKEYVLQGKKIRQLDGILQDHRRQQREITKGYGEMSKSSKSFSDIFAGGLKVFAGNLMTKGVELFGRLVSSAKEFISIGTDMATKGEGIAVAFEQIMKKTGNPKLINNLREATRGTISDLSLMQSAVNADDFKMPMEDLATLLKFVQVQAVRTGGDFEKMREQIILGIGRESKQRIDDFGISATELDKKIKSLGKSVNESDKFRVAVIEIINERLKEQGEIALTAADKEAQANVSRENSQMKIGNNLLWIKNIWSGLSASFFETIADLSDRYLPTLVKQIEVVSNKFIDWYNSSLALRVGIGSVQNQFTLFFNLLKKETKNVLDFLGTFADVGKHIFNLDFAEAKKSHDLFLLKMQKNNADFVRDSITSMVKVSKGASQTLDKLDISSKIQSGTLTPNSDTVVPDGTGDKTSIQRQKVQDSLRVLEEQHLKDMSALKQKYLNDDAITEDIHNQNVLKQQDKYDEGRKAKLQELSKSLTDPSLRIDIAKQVAEIDAKALDRQISDRDKKKKESLKKEQDLIKWNEEETKKIVTEALRFVELEEDKAYVKQMELRSQGKISEEEYQRELTNIQIKHLEERLRINGLTENQIADIRKQILQEEVNTINRAEDQRKSLFGNDIGAGLIDKMKSIDEALLSGAVTFGEAIMLRMEAYLGATDAIVQKIGGDLTGAMTNFASAEESAVARKYDKEIAAAEGNSKKQKKLEEQKQKEQNAIRAKYADKQFAVNVAMTASSTTVAAMEAYKAMAGIPIIGPALGILAAGAAITYGASQIAAAKEQRDAAKEGYFDGGFTGGVDPKEVRGYLPDGSPYHGGEFFVNRHGTANPVLAPMWNVVDEAQKHGTAGSLTKADMAKALNIPMGGYMQGGFSGTPATINQGTTDNRYNESYDRFVDVMERLEERLDKQIVAKVSITGDDGLEETQSLYDKMNKNASRN